MADILIVEDKAATQFLLRTLLEATGHRVYEAWDGEIALEMIKTDPTTFDLVILDGRMSKMDGIEFLSILQHQPSRPPVVILSAHGEKIPHRLESVVSGRLLKPFSRQALYDSVNSLLGASIAT